MIFKKKQKKTSFSAPQLITDDAPFEYAEAYNAFRTNFSFITANKQNRKIVVTSALRDEGKSSFAINMAISLAQAEHKVLLIDADLRNPSLHRYLRIMKDNKFGLSNLLSGNVKVGDCLVKTQYGFDLIAGGPVPPNPAELTASDAMHDLLDVAACHYDYIICDSPPVGIIADAAALSPLCDGVLYVIRQNFANKNQISDAIKRLQNVNAKILGTVMTQCTITRDSGRRYGYHRYSYRYGYNREDDAE